MLMEPVNALACWLRCACLKCISGLRSLGKTLNFLRCILVFDLVLKYGSDINEGNWLQLLFHFFVLTGIGASVIGMSFFSAAFQVSDWIFLVLHFDGYVCTWIPKVNWTLMDWFCSFMFKNGFFRWLHICMDWNLQELLHCCSVLTISIFFSMFSLRGILDCSSKLLVLFRHRILHYRLISFWSAMQLTFYLFVSSSFFILEVLVKLFDYFSKPNGLFSKFSVNCLLMFYFVYCNNCALKDVNGAC